MDAMFELTRSGELDDVWTTANVQRNESRFSTQLYCTESWLGIQAERFQAFASSLLDGPDTAQGELMFAIGGWDAPLIKLAVCAGKTGRAYVTAALAATLPGVPQQVFDSCTLHFATDIASIDRFAAELARINAAREASARLHGFALTQAEVAAFWPQH